MTAALKGNGLSPTDIERTVNSIVNGAAHCAILAMVEKNDATSIHFLSALARRLPLEEMEAELADNTYMEAAAWTDGLVQTMTTCLYKIAQETGYPITQ